MPYARWFAFSLVAFAFFASMLAAHGATAQQAVAFDPGKSTTLIPELQWNRTQMVFTVELVLPPAPSGVQAPTGVPAPSGAEEKPAPGPVDRKVTATLFGSFKKADYSLVIDSQVMQVGANGSFEFKQSYTLPAGKNEIEIPVLSVGPFGDTVSSQVWIRLPPMDGPRKKHLISPSLGFSLASYEELYDPVQFDPAVFPELFNRSINEVLTTLKVSYRYEHTPQWSGGVTIYKTLFALSSSLPDITAGFFGANLRAGYTLKNPIGPLRLTVLAGLYYTTMSVTKNEEGKAYFGFANLMGPQIYPSVQRVFPKGDSAQLYLKYSPIGNSFGVLSPEYNELAAGFSYVSAPLKDGNTWSVALDWARVHVKITDGDTEAISNSSSVSLSGGYNFGVGK